MPGDNEPKMKILFICSIPPRKSGVGGPQWADLYDIIGPNHRKYCEINGYDYHLDVSDIWEPVRDSKYGAPLGELAPIRYFVKFALFQHFLDPDSCSKEYDAVCWVDADCIVSRYDIKLEKFLNSKYGTDEEDANVGDIILSRDINGLHATVIMMRRTALTLGFAWANKNAGQTYFQEDGWGDQLSMRRFLETSPYDQLVWYHSVQTLCAMPPNTYPIPARARRIYEWNEESFSLHLSALSIPKRIEMAKKFIAERGLL